MKLKPILVGISTSIFFTVSTHAVTLVSWDFTGNKPADHAQSANAVGEIIAAQSTYATALSGVTSTDIIGSGNLIFSNGTSGGDPIYEDEINLQSNSGAGGVWSFDFTLAATSGTIDITGISIDLWRNGSGAPTNMAWELSTDGGANFSAFGTPINEPTSGDKTFRNYSFTDSVEASSIVLRFHPTGSTGNLHINDITITGDLNPVPEPSGVALIGIGGLALILRRRK